MDFRTLFPLAEGNLWSYKTDRGSIEISVISRESFGDKNFFILETRVENEPLQKEKYLVEPDTLWLLSRTVGGKTLFYDPPNPVLSAPSRSQHAWSWKGLCGQEPLEFNYRFLDEAMISVPAGKFSSIPLEIVEKSSTGENRIVRWFSAGTGMVKEQASHFEAELESHHLR